MYSINFLHQPRHIDMYFIVSVLITHYNFFYLVVQIVPASAIESSFSWCLCPFAITPSFWVFVCLFVWTLPYSLVLQEPSSSSCIFPTPRISPGSFYWKIVRETNWALDTECSHFLNKWFWSRANSQCQNRDHKSDLFNLHSLVLCQYGHLLFIHVVRETGL